MLPSLGDIHYTALPQHDDSTSQLKLPSQAATSLPVAVRPTSSTITLHSLTGLRGLMCLWVFFLHQRGSHGFDTPLFSALVDCGQAAVSVFFVLSGFVLFHVYSACDMRSFTCITSFLVKRIARVYPLYVLSMCISSASALASSDTAHVIIMTLTMTQCWQPSALPAQWQWNGPSWSISTEFGFYVLFPLLIAFMRSVLLSGPTNERRLLKLALTLALLWTVGITSVYARFRLHRHTLPFIPYLCLFPTCNGSDWFYFVFPPSRLNEFASGMVIGAIYHVVQNIRSTDASRRTTVERIVSCDVPWFVVDAFSCLIIYLCMPLLFVKDRWQSLLVPLVPKSVYNFEAEWSTKLSTNGGYGGLFAMYILLIALYEKQTIDRRNAPQQQVVSSAIRKLIAYLTEATGSLSVWMLTSPLVLVIGEISFAFYLFQNVFDSLLPSRIQFVPRSHPLLNCATLMVVATALHAYLEDPMYGAIVQRFAPVCTCKKKKQNLSADVSTLNHEADVASRKKDDDANDTNNGDANGRLPVASSRHISTLTTIGSNALRSLTQYATAIFNSALRKESVA